MNRTIAAHSVRRPLSRRDFLSVATIGLGGLLSGCGGGGGSVVRSTPITGGPGRGTGEIPPQSGWSVVNTAYKQLTKKWTFLVYMNAANDLEEYSILNMNQMEAIGSGDNLNLIVQYKRFPNRYDSSNGDWPGTRRYYVVRDTDRAAVNSYLLSENQTLDMGDWQSLQRFVQWGVATYPAERYCLVLWNHGAGWRSARNGAGPITRGVSYDDITGNHIDTIEFPAAIDIGGGRKWDVLAFDSSLMQMLEVAYEIRDKATYIVGSEESPPGPGYPYDRFLGNLANDINRSPRDFAIDIAQQTIESYTLNSNITHSVLDVSKVAGIVPAVDELGRLLFEKKGTYAQRIRDARAKAENYDYLYYRDIIDFTNQLTAPMTPQDRLSKEEFPLTTPPIADAAIVNAAALLRQTVQEAVIKNVRGNQHPRSNGLSIYLPTPGEYDAIDVSQANGFGQRYRALAFTKAAPSWHNFIENGPI
ncbi:MAG: clostripain-related cysteine peptidase [Capsulimonadales bacterium]|nr:clostripain-related cysteine peptidase [Capsulimonadales bacterium]